MRVVVTGGSGFLGTYLVDALIRAKHSVCILDLVQPKRTLDGARYVAGSVNDTAIVRDVLRNVDCVYHLAGIAHLWTPHRDDFDRVNHYGTDVVLAAAKEMAVPRFVHCSSYTTLMTKEKDTKPLNETLRATPYELAGPYSLSKYLAETAALKAAEDGLSVIIVNPTILVGARDHNRTPGTAMISRFLHTKCIWYTEMLLNVVHVEDVAVGLMLAAERGRSGERTWNCRSS